MVIAKNVNARKWFLSQVQHCGNVSLHFQTVLDLSFGSLTDRHASESFFHDFDIIVVYHEAQLLSLCIL